MKSLVQFIKENAILARLTYAIVGEVIVKVVKDLGKDFVDALDDEYTRGCRTDDDFEEYEMDVIDNPENGPARWKLINTVAKELKVDPNDLIEKVGSTVFFDYDLTHGKKK